MPEFTSERLENVVVPELLRRHRREILEEWTARETATRGARNGLITERELRDQAEEFLDVFLDALATGRPIGDDDPRWQSVRGVVSAISRSRTLQGFSPSEVATFVFSLKQPLFRAVAAELAGDAALVDALGDLEHALDTLALVSTEVYQRSRDEIISRQQAELVELSTPVVKLWEGVLALPLIGTLDSNRTQVVMESLLQRIVETGSRMAIIDITGVPTVDTLVAQHLLKTVAAARLMGADCVISGIRPQIAQTIVHLGVTLEDVVTKATMADAVEFALRRSGFSIRPANEPGRAA